MTASFFAQACQGPVPQPGFFQALLEKIGFKSAHGTSPTCGNWCPLSVTRRDPVPCHREVPGARSRSTGNPTPRHATQLTLTALQWSGPATARQRPVACPGREIATRRDNRGLGDSLPCKTAAHPSDSTNRKKPWASVSRPHGPCMTVTGTRHRPQLRRRTCRRLPAQCAPIMMQSSWSFPC